MKAAPPLPTDGAERLTTEQRVHVYHRTTLETMESGRRCWYALRVIVGPIGVISVDRSRECAGSLDAAQRCAEDMRRISGGLQTALAPLDTARDLERQARVAREDADRIVAQAERDRARAAGLADRAKAARIAGSALRSAVEAARLRLVGGKEVEASTLTPAQLTRSDALRTRESAEHDAAQLESMAAETSALADGKAEDAVRLRESAAKLEERAKSERKRAAEQADAWALDQRGRAWA